MEQILPWISAHWDTVLAIYGAVVACATIIVKVTPTQADDAILAKVISVISFFSHLDPKKPIDPNAPTEAIKK